MSEHDIELIKKAEKMSFIYWYLVLDLEEEAESEEAKERIHYIGMAKYHYEEMTAGCD